jgi:hypothetical protein
MKGALDPGDTLRAALVDRGGERPHLPEQH